MIRILKSDEQINQSRQGLSDLGADSSKGLGRKLFCTLFALRFRQKAEPVAINKSWDVHQILQLIERHVPDKKAAIYDMGSYNCEIPLALWARGYRHIRAADLNPKGRCIRWYGNQINFQCENFYTPNVPPKSFDVITCLSVMEHGFNQDHFLKSVSDLLKPGGLIAITTDYHPQKIDIPHDYRLFNLTYQIFNRQEIEAFITRAKDFGLELVEDQIWDESKYPISFLGHQFTFILIAFKKKG